MPSHLFPSCSNPMVSLPKVPICIPPDPTWCTDYNTLSAAGLNKLNTMLNTSAYRCRIDYQCVIPWLNHVILKPGGFTFLEPQSLFTLDCFQ